MRLTFYKNEMDMHTASQSRATVAAKDICRGGEGVMSLPGKDQEKPQMGGTGERIFERLPAESCLPEYHVTPSIFHQGGPDPVTPLGSPSAPVHFP